MESRARERAFLFAFAKDMEGNIPDNMVEELNIDDLVEVKTFAGLLFEGMNRHIESIDETISRYLKNWTIERLRAVDRCILRVALYELLFYKKTPAKVVMDEYTELAKRYGDTDSASFVNAVLDSVYRDNI
ncbi:MAG: transcription antitermination factor NusB [Myxococcota bacterium]